MIADLRPYPAVKDSGVRWLGAVPKHWEIRRLKDVFRIVGGSTPSSTEANYWDGDVVWVTPADVSQFELLADSLRRLTRDGLTSCSAELVPKGTIVVTSRAPVGNVALADVELCTNQGCKGLISDDELVNPLFGFHAVLTLKAELQSLATGTTFTEISTGRLSSVAMPLPPLPEQAAIVRFLDYANRRIRRYIRAKQKLIKLLEEQKQAIIHGAVTRGLDPHVRLKPSGVEWLGNVPEHWEVVPFKRRVGFQEGPGIMAADFRHAGVPLLRISCLQGQTASLNGCNFLNPEMVCRRWSHFAIQPGDYLLSASASTGRVVLATEVVAGAIPYTGILRLWPLTNRVFMPFVRLYMGCRPFQTQIENAKSGVGIEHFGPTHLKRMAIALPPRIEQREIVEAVDARVAPFAGATMRARREIELLKEYRASLIADVVTGKLDVREAAARLPDEVEEAESHDEADTILKKEDDGPEAIEATLEEAEA